MDPLTREELDRIEKTGMLIRIISFSRERPEWRTIEKKALDKLIATARASIPRPIAEAPRDVIIGVDAKGRWSSCKYSQSSRCFLDAVGGCFFPIAWLPIPKGGAS